MKKLFSLFALSIFMIFIISCSSDDDYIAVDYDTYPVAYDLRNVNLELINGVYQTSRTFTNPMYETDMLLIYKSIRSEEHTSELQSRGHLVCRLLLEKKKQTQIQLH